MFASLDGSGGLTLGAPETLDADDCLAQLIFHEICHWLVNGADAVHQVDWGFEPMEGLDWREWPTLRVQHALASRHGLAVELAPTTDARQYWDRLTHSLRPLDSSDLEIRTVERAQVALQRSELTPWQPALDRALRASREIVDACRGVAQTGPQVS
ncbi:MAG: hypothetical protein AB8H79_13630 [Myxococcota bacterium]